MIRHNLKLAWRQLWKYRLQSAVSIVSLAVGFACFAMAAMWIKYETTYDAFHKDAENIYVVTVKDNYTLIGVNPRALREIPELERLTHVSNVYNDSINGKRLFFPEWMMDDTNFLSLFDLEILEGTTSFVHNENEVAISDQLAKKLWGEESPIGKPLVTKWKYREDLNYNRTRTVTAVFRSWGEHSNFYFHILSRQPQDAPKLFLRSSHIMAHVSPKVDIKKLNERLDTTRVYGYQEGDWSMSRDKYLASYSNFSNGSIWPKIVPLTKLYHSNATYEHSSQFKFNHIYLFSIACGLLILCGVLNYLTMFINRLFIRRREMALRTVFGASGRRLMVQFLTEYGLLLAVALIFGVIVTFGLRDEFLTLADLQMGRRAHFYYGYSEILPELKEFFGREVLYYILLVFAVSMLASVPFIWYFRRQSLQSSIVGVGGLAKYHLFRYASTTIQISISFLCIFCTVVLLKQLDTLRHGDIGFERENRMCYSANSKHGDVNEELFLFIRSCPETDAVHWCNSMGTIYPKGSQSRYYARREKEPELAEDFYVNKLITSKETADFYGLTLLRGEWPIEGDWNVVVNEAFILKSGWKDPLNKRIDGLPIVGVIKDFHNISPLTKSEPYYVRLSPVEHKDVKRILLRHKPGMKQALMEKVEVFFKEHEIEFDSSDWIDLEERYNEMLKSEDNLRLLLSITTAVCILIALFGVWSMIMLTCEQRRKEIAIRKVHGAKVRDILAMFFREYMTLQLVAALVAFPIGYACMKPWLENYVVQTEISWWIYAGIFLAVALLVALCIGWRVWKTANARPAEEICKG